MIGDTQLVRGYFVTLPAICSSFSEFMMNKFGASNFF